MQIELDATLSANADADAKDVRRVAAALAALGYRTPDPNVGVPAAEADETLFDDIRIFQRDHGLTIDGALEPAGETEDAINTALQSLADEGAYYIWCTVRDANVRPDHARRESQMFQWNETLDGGHPGEDFNCRCWAEPYFMSYRTRHLQQKMFVHMAPIPQRKPEQLIREQQYTDAIKSVYPIEVLLGLGVSGRIIPTSRAAYRLGKNAKFNFDRRIKFTTQQLQSKFKHAKDFGITGNANKKTLEQFKKAIEDHVKSKDTQIIRGTYHKKKVTHYYNPKTGINVMKDRFGEYHTNWKPEKVQLENLLRNGSLGGSK